MLAAYPARGLGRMGPFLCLLIGVTSLVASACGDNPVSPSGQPNLTVLLTDDVADDVEEVNVYFTTVTAKPVGSPIEELGLELTDNPVDLLTLDNQVTMLAAGVVEPGVYEFVHLNIDERRSNIVEHGVQKALKVPSEEVKVLGTFTVDEDHQTTITLDFDAGESLVHLGNGEWLLQPVIVITGNNISSKS